MATTTTSNGKKCHNWTTNAKIVDRRTDKVAVRFIDACSHLTPAEEVEFDNLIEVSKEVRAHNAGTKIIQVTEHKPEPTEDDGWVGDKGNWDEKGPTAKDLRDIERGDDD